MEEQIRQLVRAKLREAQLSERMLTPAELEALAQEVRAELRGETVTESVLSNPEIFYRCIGRCDG